MRHPDKVERWPDIIPDVRHPGGMGENFRPGGMSDATCRKKERDTWHILGRIPQILFGNTLLLWGVCVCCGLLFL